MTERTRRRLKNYTEEEKIELQEKLLDKVSSGEIFKRSNKQIAEELGVREGVFYKLRSAVLKKLGIPSFKREVELETARGVSLSSGLKEKYKDVIRKNIMKKNISFDEKETIKDNKELAIELKISPATFYKLRKEVMEEMRLELLEVDFYRLFKAVESEVEKLILSNEKGVDKKKITSLLGGVQEKAEHLIRLTN